MKAVPAAEGNKAVVLGSDTVGLAIADTPVSTDISLGWVSERRLNITDENSVVRLDWPSSDFLSVRVGANPPFECPNGDEETESSDGEQCK